MPFDPSLWFLLPVGVAIAALAMSAGISGSNFWIPVYLIWLGMEPRVGFWLALLTMLFGFGSGLHRNLRDGTVNWYLGGQYLKVVVPAALAGGVLSTRAPQRALLAGFALFVAGYGSYLVLRSIRPAPVGPVAHERIYRVRAVIAGFLTGLIATGLGKLVLPLYLDHRRMQSQAEAVGTTVMLVFVANGAALLARIDAPLLRTLAEERATLAAVMLWAAPSVVIGGQLGPRIAARMPRAVFRLYVGVLLVGVGLLIGLRALAGDGG